MSEIISIGNQSFEKIRKSKYFYIDKTGFIKEWWEQNDDVTLITRPRRFGKTLNMSMMECFFSNKYSDRSDLFEGLSIWKEEKYRKLQGNYPVIFLSFAGVKANNFRGARDGIINAIANVYDAHSYLKNSDVLSEEEKSNFDAFQDYVVNPSPDNRIKDSLVVVSIQKLSTYLERYYHLKWLPPLLKSIVQPLVLQKKRSEHRWNNLDWVIPWKGFDTGMMDFVLAVEKIFIIPGQSPNIWMPEGLPHIGRIQALIVLQAN